MPQICSVFLSVVMATHDPITEQCARLWGYDSRDSSSQHSSSPKFLNNVSSYSASQCPAHHPHKDTVKQTVCFPQPEKSCAKRSFSVYYLPTLSRRGCPRLVVRFLFQVIRHATSTFVWLESYDVRSSLRHETAPQSSCRHGVPQCRSPSRGEGSSVSCHG